MMMGPLSLGRAYNIRPSDIIDPDHEVLFHMDRVMFDLTITAWFDKEARINAAGDGAKGVSVADQVEHKYRSLDTTEVDLIEREKARIRSKVAWE